MSEGKMSAKALRQAWTDFVEGTSSSAEQPNSSRGRFGENKYGAVRTGKYASKHEAEVAGKLQALHGAGVIRDLQEQVRIVLVPSNGRLKSIVYIADFTYYDHEGAYHVLDAKGFKTAVYRLKKRMAGLLLNLEIEEV